MLCPKDMIRLENEHFPEEDIIAKIDAGIRANFGKREYQASYLEMVIPLRIRNKIAAKYARCGWKYVYHISGSEKSTSFYKTYFLLSMEAIDEYDIEKYYLIQKSEVNMNEFAIYKDDKLVETLTLDGE